MRPGQAQTPYLDALSSYAARNPARLHVPGHKGGDGADPGLLAAFGRRALELDIPALTYGIDVGADPTAFEGAQRLAADAWGAARTWFLINGASQGNLAAALALAHRGNEVVVQRNAHTSTVDALVLSGLQPTFAAPEVDPDLGIAHGLTPETLEQALAATPRAVGAWVVSPTYFGAMADVRSLAEIAHSRAVPLIVDEAWGAHLAFSDELPEHALAAGADLVVSSTHKIVGSLTQSAMLHLGRDARGLIDEDVVGRVVTLTESTSPSALLCGSLDAARRHAALHGRELLGRTLAVLVEIRDQIRMIDGLDVLDERLVGRRGVFAYDPLRIAIDVRGVAASSVFAPRTPAAHPRSVRPWAALRAAGRESACRSRPTSRKCRRRAALRRARPRRAGPRGPPRNPCRTLADRAPPSPVRRVRRRRRLPGDPRRPGARAPARAVAARARAVRVHDQDP